MTVVSTQPIKEKMNDDKLTIYHNPKCSKSRETLQILFDNGLTPDIIEYLNADLDTTNMKDIVDKLGLAAAELIRVNEPAYRDAKLDIATMSDDEILAAICEYPSLLQRPIVVNGDKAVIGRPPANVLSII